MEHIERICSLESQLHFGSICSVGILPGFKDIGKYRGVGLIRTMEIAKKSYELAPPCKSNFLTKKMIFY